MRGDEGCELMRGNEGCELMRGDEGCELVKVVNFTLLSDKYVASRNAVPLLRF